MRHMPSQGSQRHQRSHSKHRAVQLFSSKPPEPPPRLEKPLAQKASLARGKLVRFGHAMSRKRLEARTQNEQQSTRVNQGANAPYRPGTPPLSPARSPQNYSYYATANSADVMFSSRELPQSSWKIL